MNVKINEKELFKLYMEWVNHVADDIEWKTYFGPEEIVAAIVRILENNPKLLKEKE